MPRVNWTIPDSSPWITYTGLWGDSDRNTDSYVNDTFHFTNAVGASASLAFNGTGVWLYGGLRENHDEYTVSVDNQNTTKLGRPPAASDLFNQTLFGTSLAPGLHNIALTNMPRPTTPSTGWFVDLDWALIEVGDGDNTTTNTDFWMDDTHPNITYTKGWVQGNNALNLLGEYWNHTFMSTGAKGEQLTVNFDGNGIALFGATSNNHGTFSVALDGAPATTYNGTQVTFRPQQLLYFASNLSAGAHSLVLTNLQDLLGTDIDYAVVSTYTARAATPDPSAAGGTHDGAAVDPAGDTDIGAIVGGVVGGLAVLLLAGVFAWLLRRRHRRRRRERGSDVLTSELGLGVTGGTAAADIRAHAQALVPVGQPAPDSGSDNAYRASIAHGMGSAYAANNAPSPFGAAPEMDMPPPNYEQVFAASGSSEGGSTSGNGSRAPRSSQAPIRRELREKGIAIQKAE